MNEDQSRVCQESSESGEKATRLSHDSPPPPTGRAIPSDEILKGAPEVQIIHRDNIYRLRATRNGKLILQK
ncbi:MAG: hemin uptake protein HemP [Pirellulales bacterium]|nr:hemin uptake protein HemP [Pirellulales bacterium]